MVARKKIVFVSVHRKERSPSQRFRFEQYIDYFEKNNFITKHFYLVTAENDITLYSKGNYIMKLFLLIRYIFKLNRLLKKIHNYDVCFVQRECIFIWSHYFERKISKKTKLIYDFDDSIFLPNVSENNKKLSFLKGYGKVKKIIKISDLVFAGNNYLFNYAQDYNKNVKIVPTTIDTIVYQNKFNNQNEKLIIGWSGSVTTIKHFQYSIPFLKKLLFKYKNIIEFKVIGDGNYYNEDLNIKGIPWRKNSELVDLCSIDIGIMPLPDDEWAEGKCGLKGLQYMALGIPTIMSSVGVNKEIIQDGVNGFLAKDDLEWEKKLELLINSKDLRKKIGQNGRKTVEDKYSVKAWQNKYLEHFNNLINEKNSTL